MFAKGTRFHPSKPSEVPGPNAYDPQDPEYDAYKRGAFLEKTDRFSEKTSDVPEHVPNNTKPSSSKLASNAKASSDRYVMLQRKVEDLERLYNDGKKSHAIEVERLKSELNRAQKANSEQFDRADKLKKQNDMLETRMNDVKKSNNCAQAEIKDLRAKLRVSEHERNQLATKQGDLGETKKALQALDTRRREELRERDRKLAELEKSLAAEKKKREMLEVKLTEVNSKTSSGLQVAKDAAKALELELKTAKSEAQEAKTALTTLQARATDTEEELLTKLEQHRRMLSRIAEEYGRLATSTVPKAKYDQLKTEETAKQLRIIRLERKLANAEGQVIELAHLIRATKDDNLLLKQQLREAEHQVVVYSSLLKDTEQDFADFPLHHPAYDDVSAGRLELQDDKLQAQRAICDLLISWVDLNQLRMQELLFHSSSLLRHVDIRDAELQTQTDQLVVLERQQEQLSKQLGDATAEHAIAQGENTRLKQQVEETRSAAKVEVEKVQRVAAQEKQAAQRLALSLQEAQAAETALKSDIEQLAAHLAEAEMYQEAYNSLADEVDALIQRNALAEEEALRISSFNAEILGHRNPAQRIMYVDRIRRELFETKQKLLMTNREKDAAISENEMLQSELNLYNRIPLGTHNTNAMSINGGKSGSLNGHLPSMSEVEYREGDMTVDEIL